MEMIRQRAVQTMNIVALKVIRKSKSVVSWPTYFIVFVLQNSITFLVLFVCNY